MKEGCFIIHVIDIEYSTIEAKTNHQNKIFTQTYICLKLNAELSPMNKYLSVFVFLLGLSAAAQTDVNSPINNLPPYIKQVTHFGQRPDWSLDGKKILFIEKPFGDVFEVEVATGKIRPMTHHFFHEGYLRANYLANGDILLSGAREFDSTNPWQGRDSQKAELWVLKSDLSGPPRALQANCKEGPAVSRTQMKIAWTTGPVISIGDIEYKENQPHLVNRKLIIQSKDLPLPVTNWNIETQNFRPGRENEILFYAYEGMRGKGAEVLGFDMNYSVFKNYSDSPETYDEAEGAFPDGDYILIQSNRHRPTYEDYRSFQLLDIYRLILDGSGVVDRITNFNDNPEYKASNPIVSDDGKYIAFQFAKTADLAGVGRGILVLDVDEWLKTLKN